MALGDGANDIEMIRAAGLGVAYQGKPVTRDAADLCLDDLNDLIHTCSLRRIDLSRARVHAARRDGGETHP